MVKEGREITVDGEVWAIVRPDGLEIPGRPLLLSWWLIDQVVKEVGGREQELLAEATNR